MQNYTFSGLKPIARDFFKNLAKNNNKEWFTENKTTYENEVREPIKSLVSDLSKVFFDENIPYIADPKKALFRINRDIRFSKDKSPYKTNMGAFFPYTLHSTTTRPVESLGLYFHFEENSCFIAGGIHMPMPPTLKTLRETIADNWKEFEQILNDKTLKKEFPVILNNEKLKNVPRGFAPDHPAAKYLKLKEFGVYCEIDHKETYTSKFVDLFLKKAKAIEPFLKFFM